MHVSITVPRDLVSDVLRIAQVLPDDFPTVHAVVDEAAAATEDRWKSWASGTPMPSGDTLNARTGDYRRSIARRPVSRADGVFQEVFTDSEYHDALNDGTRAYDLKRMLGTSFAVRRSKAGNRYLIVPFRHGAGDHSSGGSGDAAPLAGGTALPRRVTEWFRRNDPKAGGPSMIVGRTTRKSGQTDRDVVLAQHLYQYGAAYPDKLDEKHGDGRRSKLTDKGPYTWKRGLHGGMLRFRGGGYFTFRTMSEASAAASWMRPAKEGLRIVEQLADVLGESDFAQKALAAVANDFANVRSLVAGGPTRG